MQIPVVKQNFEFSSDDIFLEKIAKLLCLLYGISLSRGGVAVLGYYMKYGYNTETEKMFIKNKKVKNKWSVYNLHLELKKHNVLVYNEDTGKYELHKDYSIPIDNALGFKVLLTSNEFQTNN